ncbi:hypothetical protein JTB14_017778 [Gonioctena quinquepunctata]|nr:hypothetical protein JTB14_017778 [Gonioctena quinquepunctata]
MVIYQEKNPIENEINLVKQKPTAEQFEYDLKALNCQEIYLFKASMEPSISNYRNSSCLLTSNHNYSQFDTLLWVLCRLQHDQLLNNFCRPLKNSIPGWTPFQQLLSCENSPISTVGFSPVIPQPPTSNDVVYTAMRNFVNLCQSLNKNIAVLSCDMSIYLIAKISNKVVIREMILRIGTFHLQKKFLRCLGQYIEGSGVDSILIEANVYGVNTLASILKGTQYNRGIRAHKLMYEALRSIQFMEFIDYMNLSEDGTFNEELQQLNICLQDIREVTVDKDHTCSSDKYNQH